MEKYLNNIPVAEANTSINVTMTNLFLLYDLISSRSGEEKQKVINNISARVSDLVRKELVSL